MTLPFDFGTLRLTAPGWLALLLALPFVFTGLRTRTAASCRAFAGVALVLALAGACVERPRPATGSCVVAAIDVSASVGKAGLDSARRFLARVTPALGSDDILGSLVFAGEPRVVAHPAAGPHAMAALVPGDVDTTGPATDLGAALGRAVALCPDAKQGTVVVFTDGNDTAESAVTELALGDRRVPVYPVVPASAVLPQAAVRRVLAPGFGTARSVVPLEVVVETRAAEPLPAALRLSANGRSFWFQPVDLPPGVSVVSLPQRWKEPGQYRVDAAVELAPGQVQPPGTAGAALAVGEPLRVLFVSEHAAPVVAQALAQREIDVAVVPPASFVERADRLRDVHVVVLDDVGRAALSTPALEALAGWVAAGGALVVTGGEHLFGDPGYVGSPLERVLPVTLQSQSPTPKEREPIALYLLIDRSNSMGYSSGPGVGYGDKMEYAKRAALAVLDQLAGRDLVGAIAFDSQPYELSPLLPVAESRAKLAARIQQLRYGGGTDFKEALDRARRALVASGGRVRHVILLTDGDTNRHTEDHLDLIDQLARDEITVTAIRIGDDTVNLELLGAIARRTGGEFHHIEHVQALPQLMVRDTQRLIDSTERENAPARIGEGGEVLAGIGEDDLPRVSRWALTRAKPAAELRLYAAAGARRDPLIATWQFELGRVAAVPLDFQASVVTWPAWRGFGKLWTQLVYWVAPEALAGSWRIEARQTREGTVVRLDTAGDTDGPFALRIPGLDDIQLGRIGRWTWRAVVPGMGTRTYDAIVTSPDGERPVRLTVPPPTADGRELRAVGPNRTLLARVAEMTGGRLDPDPADVVRARPGTARRAVPLDTWLIPLAIALVLADVWTRRLR